MTEESSNSEHAEWSFRRCPTDDMTISPGDQGNLYIVQWQGEEHEGDVAVTFGPHARDNAKLFAASRKLLAALMRLSSEANLDTSGHTILCRCCQCEARLAITEALLAGADRGLNSPVLTGTEGGAS